MSLDVDTQTTQALSVRELQAVTAEADRLVVKLPPGVSQVVITRAAFEDVMSAAADMWAANLPDTPAMVTMHVAMKTAARAMLWFMRRSPLPGMPTPPELTRQDDAVVVVVKFMLSWLFGTALRSRGGVHDVAGELAGAISGASGEGALVGWDKFSAAVGTLVAGAALAHVSDSRAPQSSGPDAAS